MKLIFSVVVGVVLAGNYKQSIGETNLESSLRTLGRLAKIPQATAIDAVDDMGEKMQKRLLENRILNENPDLMDMPPWEHENKWNKIKKGNLECWFHRKSLKKICRNSR